MQRSQPAPPVAFRMLTKKAGRDDRSRAVQVILRHLHLYVLGCNFLFHVHCQRQSIHCFPDLRFV